MPTIDADGHVVETPRTWSYLREDEKQFHPLIYVRNPNDGAGSSARSSGISSPRTASRGSGWSTT